MLTSNMGSMPSVVEERIDKSFTDTSKIESNDEQPKDLFYKTMKPSELGP
jgi:hypothetical protein